MQPAGQAHDLHRFLELALFLHGDVLDGVDGGVEERDHDDQREQILEAGQQRVAVVRRVGESLKGRNCWTG